MRITHVLETHIHNDYVTGGLALAKATGAAYLVNADDSVSYDRTPLHDGDLIPVSPQMRLRVVATPGHTFTHLSYVLEVSEPGPGTSVLLIAQSAVGSPADEPHGKWGTNASRAWDQSRID